MRWDELQHGREIQVRVRRPDPNSRITGPVFISGDHTEVSIETAQGHNHGCKVLGGGGELRTLLDAKARLVVAEEMERGTTLLVGRTFAGENLLGDPLRIAMPPPVLENVKQRGNLTNWLADEFCFNGVYFAWTGAQERSSPVGSGAFELLGRRQTLSVKLDGGQCVAVRLKKRARPRPDALLLRANIELLASQSAASASALEGADRAALDGSPWFAVWAEYQKAEEKVLAALRVRLGRIPFQGHRMPEGKSRQLVFQLQNRAPVEWTAEEQPFDLAVLNGQGKEIPIGRCLWVGDHEVLCEVPELGEVPDSGELMLSTVGDDRRLRRRQAALDAMRDNTAKMPDLGVVLDGRGRVAREGATRRPVTGATRRILGDRELTEAQKRAVEIALNTPDIAIIQGPPGTGKTTVIRVITQRLHEEKRSPVLLTAYQHQAVLRVLEGVETGGVPAIRIGGPRGEDPSEGLRPVQAWIKNTRTAARRALEALPNSTAWTARSETLRRLARAWRRAPGGIPGARTLLWELHSLVGALLPGNLADHLTRADDALVTQSPVGTLDENLRRRLLKLVGQQFTTAAAWQDGGPAVARRLGRALSHAADELQAAGLCVGAGDLRAIELAGQMPSFEPAPKGFLDDFATRLAAVSRLLAPPPPRDPLAIPVEVEAALNAVLAWVDEQAAASGPGLADALGRFEQRLQDDPTVVPEVLRRYATAVGSSVSQAVGREMADLHDDFDTVIVDEAARANPLDMLVALCLGKRLIFVGDQAQLPHMLEPRLEAAVNDGRAADASAILRESLFQRLWKLYESCPPGGIVRTVTLVDQFRMHPVIGKFISDTFYAEPIVSRTDPLKLCNDTGLFDGKPIAFVHVAGDRERGRYERRCEAEALADRVDALRQSLAGENWTVGVISFYRQQVTLLERIRDERGWGPEVSVGTVDAFQGREFDAVFLSCVRSGGGVGFLAMPNRLNVAMSRARRLLVAFGDQRTVRQVPEIDAFWNRVTEEGCHDSV